MLNDDILINSRSNFMPFNYKLLEWKLIINRELYESKIIDFKVFSIMEHLILDKMNKITDKF